MQNTYQYIAGQIDVFLATVSDSAQWSDLPEGK